VEGGPLRGTGDFPGVAMALDLFNWVQGQTARCRHGPRQLAGGVLSGLPRRQPRINLVAETILASVHVQAHKQAGHMDASDLIKALQTPHMNADAEA
jgi:hypothetical protein